MSLPKNATAEQVRAAVANFFSPDLVLRWKGPFRKKRDGWWGNTTRDESILRQLMQEAGISSNKGVFVSDNQLDAIMNAAGVHGLCVETEDIES